MTEPVSPPTYAQQAADSSEPPSSLQVLITPCTGSATFQNGYLGADNEHCSIEGELQIKGAGSFDLESVSIAFRTVETVQGEQVELASSELTLFSVPESGSSSTSQASSVPPSTLPFSIPLADDIPQAVWTPTSSITHTLIATLTPRTGSGKSAITKSTPVEITRYSSHPSESSNYAPPVAGSSTSAPDHAGPSSSGRSSLLSPDPLAMHMDSPAEVTIQLPRAVYRVGEAIPLYVTIPPPPSAVVRERGLRLRNVKADFIRTVSTDPQSGIEGNADVGNVIEQAGEGAAPPKAAADSTTTRHPDLDADVPSYTPVASTSHQQSGRPSAPFLPEKAAPPAVNGGGETHVSVLRRSGAACRFHSQRPIRLRLVLHDTANHNDASPTATGGNITQSTLGHRVSFHIEVTVSYTTSLQGHGQASSSTVTIPIAVLPPVAPARVGDFDQDLDTAYHKKHDPPPMHTHRHVDVEQEEQTGDGGPSDALPSFDDLPSSTSAAAPPPHPLAPNAASPPSPPPFSEASPSAALSGLYSGAPPSFDDAAGPSNQHSPASRPRRVSFPPSFDTLHPPGLGHPGSQLPSFSESESHVHPTHEFHQHNPDLTLVDEQEDDDTSTSAFGYWAYDQNTGTQSLHFPGEGSVFGFSPDEEYDGIISLEDATSATIVDGRRRSAEHDGPAGGGSLLSSAPPPGIEESIAAAVTAAFAAASTGGTASHRLSASIVNAASSADMPPPPPALDDPSDLPPTIDAGVHALSLAQQTVMERAMSEAAAAHTLSNTSTSELVTSPPPIAPVLGRVVVIADPPPAASVPDDASGVDEDEDEGNRPPPYLGVPMAAPSRVDVRGAIGHHDPVPPSPSVGGPPPYVG